MLSRNLLFLIGWLITGQAFAKCDSLPWKMGMSPAEVAGITECGPYKSFSNGDLETYKGVFDGKEENFQFFFEDQKLRRIGIYLYEGKDPAEGAKEWLALYGTLSKLFGKVETPDNNSPFANEADRESFTAKALEMVQGPGKAQMAPIAQPKTRSFFQVLCVVKPMAKRCISSFCTSTGDPDCVVGWVGRIKLSIAGRDELG